MNVQTIEGKAFSNDFTVLFTNLVQVIYKHKKIEHYFETCSTFSLSPQAAKLSFKRATVRKIRSGCEFPPNVPIRQTFPAVGPKPPEISTPFRIISAVILVQSHASGTATVVKQGLRHS